MGSFVYFCAGADKRDVSGRNIKALLLNVPNDARNERAVSRSLDLVKSSKAKTVMLDSGGYTLLRSQEKGWEIGFDKRAPIYQPHKINLTPWHVAQAAKALNPHIMVALDFPIKKTKEKVDQEKEFRSKLEFNVQWAIQTADLREKHCPGISLFIPIQSYSLEQLDIFFKKIHGIDFDGVSMPVRNLNLDDISVFLTHFYHIGIKRVHLLGTSSFWTMALCAYMARNHFEWVSLDSTSWRIAAQFGRYFNPDLSRRWIVDDGVSADLDALRCQCPWCKGKTFSNVKGLAPKDQVALLRFHNVWTMQKTAMDLFKSSRSPEEIQKFLKRRNIRSKKADELSRCLMGLYTPDRSTSRKFLVGDRRP